ncbi:hypothetical protein [Endozoicomonas acroporae]|uniref:hypothetical protein n=1 Tax=Endozoicomonas acroporae TaxID=1701104 RepID=UPI003D78C158
MSANQLSLVQGLVINRENAIKHADLIRLYANTQCSPGVRSGLLKLVGESMA